MPLDRCVVTALVLARLAGLCWFLPGLHLAHLPRGARLVLPLAVTLLVAPLCDPPQGLSRAEDLVVPLCREIILGLVFGLGLWAVLAGMQAAGSFLGQLSGLALSDATDAVTGAPASQLANLFHLLAVVLFLTLGGHRQAIAAVLDSFRWMPPGEIGLSGGAVEVYFELIGASLVLALRVAAPIAVVLAATALALGLVQRALPQLNAVSVGLGIQALVALLALFLFLGGSAAVLEQGTGAAMERLRDALLPLARGFPR